MFISKCPSLYKDIIQYDEPKNLVGTIRKVKYLYEQRKGRENIHKYLKYKKKEKPDQRKKGFKPPFKRNNPERYQRNEPT